MPENTDGYKMTIDTDQQ